MTKYVKAYIEIKDVPYWQVGEEVTVHFRDTMCIRGVCKEIPKVDIKSVIGIVNKGSSIPTCVRCGRKLRNPEAQQRGYGEVCWKKHLIDKQNTLF